MRTHRYKGRCGVCGKAWVEVWLCVAKDGKQVWVCRDCYFKGQYFPIRELEDGFV